MTPVRSTANGIAILTTVGPTSEKGYGESHVGLRFTMGRRHGKALTAFMVNKYPHMLAKCCCPGYIEIQNFANANALDSEYHLARWCALLLSEVLCWVKADVGRERERESVLERLYERRDYLLRWHGR
jgi:hypothetical protein